MSSESIPERVRALLRQKRQEWEAHSDASPTRKEIRRPEADTDQTDEAAAIEAFTGGEVHAGDVAEVVTSDPAFWRQNSFELQFAIEAVARAEIADAVGRFSFTLYFLAPDQGADLLVVEGDLPQTARAFLGALGPPELVAALQSIRQDYRQRPEAEVAYDVQVENLGLWTAYAAREDGRFWLLEGSSALIPATAQRRDGAPYQDFTCYYGPSQAGAQWELRLVDLGGFSQAFQGERLALKDVRFWRRSGGK